MRRSLVDAGGVQHPQLHGVEGPADAPMALLQPHTFCATFMDVAFQYRFCRRSARRRYCGKGAALARLVSR
jgi:hypothetical protein